MLYPHPQWNHDADNNAQIISEKLDFLGLLSEGFTRSEVPDWSINRDFWQCVTQINDMFQSLSPLRYKDRQGLQNRLSVYCSAQKKRLGAESKKRIIALALESILPEEVLASTFLEPIKTIRYVLEQSAEKISEAQDIFERNYRDLDKEDRCECQLALQKAREALDNATGRKAVIHEERRCEFRRKTQANLDKTRQRLLDEQERLALQQAEADALRDQITTARKTEHKEWVQNRLQRLEGIMKASENCIKNLESWIQQDEERLKRC